jgi:hypothetical protein
MDSISSEIEYKTPITLLQALNERRNYEHNTFVDPDEKIDFFVKEVKKDEELASMQIKKYIAKGSSAVVFETPDGNILKLTEGSHFPLKRPVESFDVPIYKMGKVGGMRYYIEEKLFQHGLSEGFVMEIIDKIKERGYKPSDIRDFDIHQIGISKDGNLYLLDPECAKYKNIFSALWRKTKKFFKHL